MWYKDIEDPMFVQCKICGVKKMSIIRHIRKEHNMTIKEYMETYKTKRVRGRKPYTMIKRALYNLKKEPKQPKIVKPRKKSFSILQRQYYTTKGLTNQQADILIKKVLEFLSLARNSKEGQDKIRQVAISKLKYLNDQFDMDYIELKLNGMINKYKDTKKQEDKVEQSTWVSPGKIKYD